MVRFSLNIKTCCLYAIWESKIKFGQKFFASPKICTPVHLWPLTIAETINDAKILLFLSGRCTEASRHGHTGKSSRTLTVESQQCDYENVYQAWI